MSTRLYCSMDLHSNNVVIVVTDESSKMLINKKVRNNLPSILEILEHFRPYLTSIAIESTYNWYWLADGLEDNGYSVCLVNTAAVKAYNGNKHTDDTDDARFLCDLQAMDRLPTGYIYPRQDRAIRDMLRRRSLYVKQRTAQMLSTQNLFARQTGKTHSFRKILEYEDDTLYQLLAYDANVITTKLQCETRDHLTKQIRDIEKVILGHIRPRPGFTNLQTIPGVGPILGITIMLETGNISRFHKCGNYVSYCRCAPSKRMSNNKPKGKNNTRNGNPYLSWAFIEAAAHAIGCCPRARKYYDRKLRRTQITAVAMKSVAAKLSKAAFFVMANNQEFMLEKAFG